ncbi:UNVERIFIED_CONTAM: MAP3K epsilon protein kinase [Sesamum radiatum]|uniref:MAP3K epsilon protein kinase n=1 Tax=Sesamum radiatum TaxID=300843 RepID=A0AAW2N0B4_SESRA
MAKTFFMTHNHDEAMFNHLNLCNFCRNIEESGPGDAESSRSKQGHSGGTPNVEKESKTEPLSSEVAEISKTIEDDVSNANATEGRAHNLEENVGTDQPPLSSANSRMRISSNRVVNNHESTSYDLVDNKASTVGHKAEVLTNSVLGPTESKKANDVTGEFERSPAEHGTLDFNRKGQDYSPRKVVKASMSSRGNELSKFSDPPNDASLDDLFHPLENVEGRIDEASTSASSHGNQGNTNLDSGSNDLATKLRATIAQKQMQNDSTDANGGDIIRLMMGVLKEEVIDIDNLGFEDKLPTENRFHIQVMM